MSRPSPLPAPVITAERFLCPSRVEVIIIDFVAVVNRLYRGKRNTDFCPKAGQNDLLAAGFLDCRDEVLVIPGVHRGSLDRLLAGKYRAELRPHISAERLRLDGRQDYRHIEHP